jgi:protein TonB
MRKKRFLRFIPAIAGLFLIALIGFGLYMIKDLFQKPVKTKKQVQQITVLQPPPPPPPPPIQKQPEPEVKEEKIEQPEPEQEPDQAEDAPPGEDLGVDAEGTAGSDSFGLVGKKGGHSLIGGGGNAIIWYGQQMQRQIAEALQRSLSEKIRNQRYSVNASIWVGADGNVTRVELGSSSGRPEVDDALKAALGSLRMNLKMPPPNMPQPVKIRIRS